MEGRVVLNPETDKAGGNKAKGEKQVKGSVAGMGGRKKLADISNLPRNQDAKQPSVSLDSKEYISKIHQENMAMVRLLTERNKIIELSGIELQKLRINFQKLQQQNKQLAQANSQMIGELNSAKDRLKILQHELGCTKPSSGAIKLMAQEKVMEVNGKNQVNGIETTECDNLVGCTQEKKENNKPKGNRISKVQALDSMAINQVQTQEKVDKKSRSFSRRQSARFRSPGQELTEDLLKKNNAPEPSTVNSVQDQKKVGSKRSSSRRQSARFRSADQELTEDLLEMSDASELNPINSVQDQKKVESKRVSLRRQYARLKSQEPAEEPVDEFHTNVTKYPVSSSDDILRESCPPSISLLKNEPEAPNSEPESEAEESRRSPIRPKRKAVEKIHSYKELSINVKMRRSE